MQCRWQPKYSSELSTCVQQYGSRLLSKKSHEDPIYNLMQGQTLLSLAAEEGRKESVEYLSRHGVRTEVHVIGLKVDAVCHLMACSASCFSKWSDAFTEKLST